MSTTTSKHEFYYLTATADKIDHSKNLDLMPSYEEHPVKQVQIEWAMIRGMTDDGQPGWTISGYGGPIKFELRNSAEQIAEWSRRGKLTGYGFENGRDVKIHFKTVETTVVTTDVVVE